MQLTAVKGCKWVGHHLHWFFLALDVNNLAKILASMEVLVGKSPENPLSLAAKMAFTQITWYEHLSTWLLWCVCSAWSWPLSLPPLWNLPGHVGKMPCQSAMPSCHWISRVTWERLRFEVDIRIPSRRLSELPLHCVARLVCSRFLLLSVFKRLRGLR